MVCPTCQGAGTILGKTVRDRARKGGFASYRRSLEPGQLSMSQRGEKGGAPRLPTLADLGGRGPS